MLLNLCNIILPFLLSYTNRRCANLPRMSVRAYGSMKRKKKRKFNPTGICDEGDGLVAVPGSFLHVKVQNHTGQCKSTGGCYNELVVAFFSTGGGVKGK